MVKTRKNQRKNLYSKLKGGKVIGSGGFGCIFRPALKCKIEPHPKHPATRLPN